MIYFCTDLGECHGDCFVVKDLNINDHQLQPTDMAEKDLKSIYLIYLGLKLF